MFDFNTTILFILPLLLHILVMKLKYTVQKYMEKLTTETHNTTNCDLQVFSSVQMKYIVIFERRQTLIHSTQ